MRETAAAKGRVEAAFARRAARADALARDAQTAAEPLRFAAGLYRIQGRLAATVESAHAGRPLCGRLEPDLDSFQDCLVEVLRFAAESGPSALAEEARARGRDEASVVRSRLLVFWSGDSEPGEGYYLSRALLRPYVEVLRGLGIAPDRVHRPGECPFCGGAPWIAARRSESDADGARRLLGCALCGEKWPFGRIRCPCCFEEDPTKLPSFQSETYPTVRIEACETCRRYVKSIDLTADARAIPEVDDLVSLGMDLWAQEQGYARVAPGLAGILTVGSLERLMGVQRALRSRFDDFHRALKRGDRAALEVALIDFDENFRRWSLAEEQTLLPALARLALAGRDPQRELRLEYAQIREITALLRRRLAEGVGPADLFGFADNLDVRLAAHEAGMEGVYYPAADAILLPHEREALERACPEP